jgi:N-acylneuraminate cytidylyltransferase
MRIAVIPARGGSKRIPRKNIREFCGKPMIAWSIEAARASGLFDRIIISTDDAEIADVGRKWGAEAPFVRPPELSNDYAGTIEVIAHAAQWALDQGIDLEAVCCIYATAPFIRVTDLQHGLKAIQSGNWVYSFAVTDFAAPIFRSFKKTSSGELEMFFPEHYDKRSQDLPIALHDAGQFYWGRPHAWIKKIRVFEGRSFPVLIPRWRAQDIDTKEDWVRAEILAPAIMSTEH